jgi:transketolase
MADVKTSDLTQLGIDTIRALSMDAVQAANSGHPGTAMALAPLAHTIFTKYLRHNPANPRWANRDRFVLSCGHASVLLYSTLHLTGYDLSLDDIKTFRQLGSKCAGHPEYGLVPGVETTTGPLGQGCGNSVGMAMAAKWLGARFNRGGHEIVDHNVFVLASDGDMMEGLTSEAASLAGHLGLDNLIWIYDDNEITIEGKTELAFSEDVGKRFEAYGWHVQHLDDVNDLAAVEAVLDSAVAHQGQPSFIVAKSKIGYGAPNKECTASAHGEPLGDEEIALTKQAYGWDPSKKFHVPAEVREAMSCVEKGRRAEAAWREKYDAFAQAYPELAQEWETIQRGELPEGWDKDLPVFPADEKGAATRVTGGKAINGLAKNLPWLIGGSADLAPSTKTLIDGESDFAKGSYVGRNLHFGIREHGMTSIVNGMCLSGLRAYGASFLVFSDYARPTLRLAAIMHLPAIHVYTHDSIGVGEDGPTHQPVEQVTSLRTIPGVHVLRPGDANEASEAWRYAVLSKTHPCVLALTRQNLPTLDRTKYAPADGLHRGAYVLFDSDGSPDVILMASGSEVQWCVGAAEVLAREGTKVRVVSMPCWEAFEAQDQSYRDEVLPPSVTARVAVEAASPFGWERYVGRAGAMVTQNGFGASGPVKAVMDHFGFTVDAVVAAAKAQLQR